MNEKEGREETVFLRVTMQAKLDHNVLLIMDHLRTPPVISNAERMNEYMKM